MFDKTAGIQKHRQTTQKTKGKSYLLFFITFVMVIEGLIYG